MTRIGQAVFSLLVLVTFLPITEAITWAAEKSAKPSPVRIGYVSRSILDMPFMIARDRGYFREEGLEPELIFMKAAQTIPAMLAAAPISARRRGPVSQPR
jgi:ABC-type nitrate/sulfonate/bicarbonate transport system substrate-binding protein